MSHELGTRALLDSLAEGTPGDLLTLDELLERFRARAFGVFLLVVLLPAFLPLPVGLGAVSGPLVSLVGVQLLLQFEHPWLPRFIARRPFARHTLSRFRDRAGRWLQRLEKFSRPRAEILIDHGAARACTGALLLVLGILLSLPIPLTNYPFGLVLLAYAIALIERDGRLLLLAWLLGLAEMALFGLFSGQLADWAGALWR